MNTNPFVNCTQPTIILDDSVQKVDVFTNSKTTSQICVSLNRIISGLDDEKKSYGLQRNLQDRKLQPNQCLILYAFFDKHGNACFVPTTDDPCYVDFEPGTIIHPGIRLDRGAACQVDSKVYRNPKYDSMRGNSTNGSNQGNTDHLAQIESATAQIETDYEEALQNLLTTDTSSSTV